MISISKRELFIKSWELFKNNAQFFFNIGYILEVLAIFDTEIVHKNLYGEESSCTIQEPEYQSEVYVIMPMRL